MGDWREEIIWEHSDRAHILIFTTTSPSTTRLYTLTAQPGIPHCLTVKGYMQSHQNRLLPRGWNDDSAARAEHPAGEPPMTGASSRTRGMP